jgi:hypothetical protein
MHRSSAGTWQRPEPAGGRRPVGGAGRHQASGGGRWRAALARHPRYALFGIGLGIAVLAGVVMITLPGHSVRSGAGGCGLMVCGTTLPPSGPATAPRGRPTHTGPLPSPVSQIPSAARRTGRRLGRPVPTQHPTHGHPSHPAHPTPPSPSRSTRPPRPTPTPTTTTIALPGAACNWTAESSHSAVQNLKELRPGSAGRSELRILFAFDPWRSAILLVAGDKASNWREWYRQTIPRAEQLLEIYLKERAGEEGRG